jgi:hypothetical protein
MIKVASNRYDLAVLDADIGKHCICGSADLSSKDDKVI